MIHEYYQPNSGSAKKYKYVDRAFTMIRFLSACFVLFQIQESLAIKVR